MAQWWEETLVKLHKERAKIDEMIARLEDFNPRTHRAEIPEGTIRIKSRAGRRSVPIEERREIAKRMRDYHAARKANEAEYQQRKAEYEQAQDQKRKQDPGRG